MIEPTSRAAWSPGWLPNAIPLLTFIVLGLPAGAVGVAWPPMRATFGAPLAGLGLLLATVTVAYAAGTLSSGPLGVRLGGAPLVILGCLLSALGLLGIAAAPLWWLVPALGLLIGAGAGFIDGAVNTYVSLTRGVRYMGWLHASWALGAAVAPQIVTVSMLVSHSWRPALAFTGLCFVLCSAGVALQRHEWTWRSRGGGAAAHQTPVNAAQGSYWRAVALLALVLLLAAGLEATAGDWSYTQLTLGRSMGTTVASWGATLFWAGLAGGRVVLGVVGDRLEATRLLDLGMLLSATASLMYWFTPALVASLVALPLLGLAVSVIYPLMMSLTPSRVGATMTGHAIGFGLAAGTVGGGMLPAIIGVVLQDVGLFMLGPALSAMAIALGVLHLVSRDVPRSVRPLRDRPAS